MTVEFFTSPLIAADEPYALAAVLGGLIVLGMLGGKTRFGQYVNGVSIVMLGGAFCSNLGLIPFSAPLYDIVLNYLVPLAIPLLLFKADLRRFVAEAGPMTGLFLMGALFSIIGTLLAVFLIDAGPEESKVAGTFAATYIGGSMNLVAVSSALQFDDLGTVAGALAADNVVGASYLILISLLSSPKIMTNQRVLLKKEPVEESLPQSNPRPGGEENESVLESGESQETTLMTHIAFAVALSSLVCGVSGVIAEWIGLPGYAVLFITLFAVILANCFPRRLKTLRGEFELGTLFMFVFFAVIGASTNVSILLEHSIALMGFAAVVILVHLSLLLLVSRLFRFDLADTLIASNACIAGPATAAAMAASRGWTHLVVPSVMCGVLGYVIANFIGLSLAGLLGMSF